MQDLTSGSIPRHLFKTASFMLVTMLFQTLYFLVDLYWVGRLGKEAVAAVALCGNLTFVVFALTQMLSVGTTTVVSHAVGRRDPKRARHAFNQSLLISAIVGLVFLAVALAVHESYARTLAADDVTAALAADYLLWFIPAMALQFGIASMAAALRGSGNFRPGMVVQTATVVINIILAPILMFGWGTGTPLGVAGAAIASLVAIAIGTAWLSVVLPSERRLSVIRGVRVGSGHEAVGRSPQDRPPGWRRVRADGGLSVRRVHALPPVRIGRASGVRHWHARTAGRVHAGCRARVCGRPGRRPELRRPAFRSRS